MAKLPIKVKAELERIQSTEIVYHHGVVVMYKEKLADMDERDYINYGHMKYAEGRLESYYLMIEATLKAYNCYYGFSEWHINRDGDRVIGYRRYHFQ